MMATMDSRPDRISNTSAKKPSASSVPPPPIHSAIINKDLKSLQKLIAAGDTPQLHPITNETPLHVAARNGALECMKWLLENHVNSLFDKDRDGSTPAHYCAVYGQLEALKVLFAHDVKRKHEVAKCVDENGLSIMSMATLQGDLAMVTWLVDNFPEMGRIKDTINGDLPVHFAAAGGSLEIIKLYVQKYGRQYAEEADSRNIKPVYYAAQNGKLDVLKYLLTEVKVDSKAREKGGMTIMHAATTGNQLPVVKWLVEYLGPKTILSRSYDGATPLHIAAAQGFSELLTFFLENLEDTSDINVRDDILATPAHDAAEFGEDGSMLILLKHGADISIKDKENKTPHDLALEKNRRRMISMISDYREKGQKGLSKYETTELHSNSNSGVDTPSNDLVHRTSMITDVKMEASSLMEKRKGESVSRKTSLLKLTDPDEEDSSDELEKQLMQPRPADHSRKKISDENSLVPHQVGPDGDLYAVVNKKHSKHKRSSREQMQYSDADSQASFSHRSKTMNGFGDPGAFYKGNQTNMETASNFSRPSRVKYYDNDTSSSIGSSVSQRMEGGRNNLPGFHQPGTGPPSMTGYPTKGMPYQQYPYMMPPGPGGGYPYPNYQYPPFNAMVAQHYGMPYAVMQQQYMDKKPKTTGERMHMEALQRSGHALYGPPAPPGFPGYAMPRPPYRQGPPMRGRGRMRPSSGHSSTRSVPVKRPGQRHHRDREIGFGPSSISDDHLKGKAAAINHNLRNGGESEFHPLPPPITKQGKSVDDQRELQSVDENFIMVQADVEGKVPTRASEGTTLHRARVPKEYDGRYDQYIETDSEEEPILDEHISVVSLAECALILALGPICGLAGISKLRKPEPKEKISPAIFAEMEAQKTSKQWGSQDEMNRMSEIPLREETKKTRPTLEDWTDVLGMSTEDLNKPTSGQFIGGSIRARHDAMKNLRTSTMHQSLASLTKDDDDDDDEILSVVVGGTSSGKKKSKSKHSSSKETRKKSSSEKKGDESKKKKKTKMIVKPSKSKKDKEKEHTLQKQSETGPIEVKNTAVFDSSDSDQGKKKKKKSKKKDKEKRKGKGKQPQTSDEEFDEILSKTQQQFDEIWDLYPKTSDKESESITQQQEVVVKSKQVDDEIEELDKMFPQHKTSKGDGPDEHSLARFNEMRKSESLTPQQEIRMQVIQSIIAGNDSDLKKQMLALISEGWNPVADDLESSSATDLTAEIEAKIIQAQEKQAKETAQHIKSQAERSETWQLQMHSEMKEYMEGIRKEFADQKILWERQLEEQRRLLENEKKKNKQDEHLTDVKNTEDVDGAEDSDDSFELVDPKIIPSKIMTKHKADIAQQDPLKWEDYATTGHSTAADSIIMPPPPPSLKMLLNNVNDIDLKTRLFHNKPKRTTSVDLLNTEEALRIFTQGAMDESDEEAEFTRSVAKVATRKRADVRSSTKM